MSIQAPQGILNIPNAILRVGKLSVDEVVGADTILNTVARNTILLVDDDTYDENKNWALKLPNAWAGEFECNTASAGNYSEFNFYNEGASSNAQGYNLTFNDTTVELRYDGTLLTSGTIASTVTGTGVKKVRLMFERTILSVTVDGVLVFTHDDTGGPRPRVYSTTAGGFLNFFTNGGAIKNLKIVNEKWMSDGTSNIAYVGGGEVAVGKALAFNRVSNVSQIKVDSNVVTEYTGPHDRPLRKYPEVAMTANDNSSTSGYSVVQSTQSTNSTETRKAWSLFNHVTSGGGGNTYHGDDDVTTNSISRPYNNSDGTYQENPAESLGGVNGTWLYIRLPKKISLESVRLTSRYGTAQRTPRSGTFLGSNDAVNWTILSSFSDITLVDPAGTSSPEHTYTYNVNSTVKYEYFGFVWEKIGTNYYVNIEELELYGYEEGSGSLDTTLKTVYNVPATTGTQLEVYYDAKDLTTMPTTVTDLAGGDQNGTVTGHSPTLDETNGIESFKFDGVDDYITTTLTNPNTDWVHSVSMWVYPTDISDDSVNGYIFAIGPEVSNQVSALRFRPDGFNYTRWLNGGSKVFNGPVISGRWHHVTLVSPGSTDVQVYLDGRLLGHTSDSLAALTLPQNTSLSVGRFAASVSFSRPFNGSIANFRLYSKALNADQVKELYDYQKDYFLGSKSQVTLYKGHLGVGVTEPSGQLELAGDERIQEYPPGPMDDNETLIPGHGVFCVSASSLRSGHQAWHAFDKTKYASGAGLKWASEASQGDTFTGGDSLYNGTNRLSGTSPGAWLKIKLPYKIRLQYISLFSEPTTEQPEDFGIYGSNDDNTWDHLFQKTGATANTDYVNYTINSISCYRYFAILVTRVISSTTILAIDEWKLFGTPGPTTLDKGSLSLTRSLDVPRISRYDVDTETPRPEKLVLDFDTTVNSSPTDISGKGNHGTFNGTNMNYSSADKAFVFNGTDDYIQGTLNLNGSELNSSYTISLWVKSDSTANDNAVFMFIGSSDTGDAIGFRHHNNISSGGTEYRIYHFGVKDTSVTGQPSNLNQWRHLVAVYDGTNQNIYVDGVFAGKDAAANLGLPNNPTYSIGFRWDGGLAAEYFDGMISNPKIYSVALEPSEVQKLYRLGRTGRSMVISDTAVGIGKVPEAQLDVRGVANFGSRVGIGTNNPTEALHIYGNGTDPTYIWAIGDTSDRAGIAFSEDRSSKNAIIEYDGTGSNAGNYLAIFSGVSSWVGKGGGLNYIPSNGRVGIGKTDPEGRLDISGPADTSDYKLVLRDTTSNLTFRLGLKPGTSGYQNGWTTIDPNGGSSSGVAIYDALYISGTLSVSSTKNFLIDHPLQPTAKKLVHAAVESPRVDLIYRGTAQLKDGRVIVNIDRQCVGDESCAMEDGTFEALCRDPVYYLQNTTDFNRLIGTIDKNLLTIISEDVNSNANVNWMVVAERKDRDILESPQTNDDGRFNTEIIDTSERVNRDGSERYPST